MVKQALKLIEKIEWKCPTLQDVKQESRIKSEHGSVVSKISSDKEKDARKIASEYKELYAKAVMYRGDINTYFITKYNIPKSLRSKAMLNYNI